MALGDDGAQAARALARGAYAEPRLRPGIDNAAAEVLVGQPPAPDAPPSLRELASVRASLGTNPEDPATKRLLTALGQEHRVEIVVAVTRQEQRFAARVLRVATASFDPVQILSSPMALPEPAPEPAEPAEPAEPTEGTDPAPPAPEAPPVVAAVEWPGAVDALLALMPAPAAPPPAPTPAPALAPEKTRSDVDLSPPDDEDDDTEWYENPWFWGSAGAVAAVGVTVLVLAVSTEDAVGNVNLGGRVSP